MDTRNLFDIEPQEFILLDSTKIDEKNIQYELTDRCEEERCPFCNSTNLWKFGTKELFIRDLPSFNRNVGLHIFSQKYRCKDCKNIWTPSYKSIDVIHRMTRRLCEYIQQESVNKPFSVLERELSISDSTIKRVFSDYVGLLEQQRELHAPRILGIDENHISRQYRAVFTDIENKLILDLIKDRKKESVIKWLKALPDYDRIECVTMDMWSPYKDAVYDVLGNDIYIVVDKFHVIQLINNTLETIRRRLNQTCNKAQRKYLKNSRWLLLYNSEDLNYTQSLALKELFAHYPVFEEPYMLKEEFRDIYQCSNRKFAEISYDKWCSKAIAYPEFQDAINTINKWYKEIFNYFDFQFTNAVTEASNRLINEIAQRGRGYSFDALRAKVLYNNRACTSTKFRHVKTPRKDAFRIGFATPFDMMGDTQISFGYTTKNELIHGSGTNIEVLRQMLENEEL